jgi:L-iditol 2-dehydrogenase
MKALVFIKTGEIEYCDQPDPQLMEGFVLVRVKAVGICGSDILGFSGKTTKRIPPLIMGHELSGEVWKISRTVKGWNPGDRVAVQPILYCGGCSQCLRGEYNICDNRRLLGAGRTNGGMAELVAVPAANLVKIGEIVSWTEAAMSEPVAVALHAVKRGKIGPTDSVAIIGAGAIGLFALLLAKQTTTGTVTVFDIDTSRLELARQLGADFCFNPIALSGETESLKETTPEGFNVVVEAAGFSESLKLALKVIAKKGRLINLGGWNHRAEIDLSYLVTKEVQMIGSFNFNGEFKEAVELIERGKVNVRHLISRSYRLEEGAKAFADLLDKEKRLLKVVLINES